MSPTIILVLFSILSLTLAANWWESGISKSLNSKNFDETLNSGNHIVIEFYAQYCVYCKMMQPEWDKLAEHYMGKSPARGDVVIAKLDGGVYTNIANRYGINNFPTIVIFKKGEMYPAATFYDDRTFDQFKRWIERVAGPEEVSEEPDSDVQDNDSAVKQKLNGNIKKKSGNAEKGGDADLSIIEEKLDHIVEVVKSIKEKDNSKVSEALTELNKKLDESGIGSNDVNFSHGFSFLLLGVILGVGASFTYINYKKLGKKTSHLVD